MATDGHWKYVRDYIVNSLRNVHAALGFDTKMGESFTTRKLRKQTVEMLCDLGHKGCTEKVLDMFTSLVRPQDEPSSSDQHIPNELRKVVYCVGIREGGEREWDLVWDQFLKEDNKNEQTNMRRALACTKQLCLLTVLVCNNFFSNLKPHQPSIGFAEKI